MNRIFIVLAFCGVVLSVAAATQVAVAQPTLTEDRIDQIRQSCTTAQTTLQQLRVSDAGLRTDRGQLYESILTKLMAPLNSRIALNRLDGLGLGSIALDYDSRLGAYRDKYHEYERSLSRTIQISCTSDPARFYESLSATRDLRQDLHQETAKLLGLLDDYKAEFESFATEIEGKENG